MIPSNSTEPAKCQHDSPETKLTRKEILQRITKKRWNIPTGDMVEFPPLNCKDDLPAWIARVEEDLMTGGIPRSQWADAAILYLAGYEPLNMSMRKQRARRLEAGGLLDLWIWEEFKESLSQVLEERDCRPTGIQGFREDHPIAATVATVGLVTAGGLFLAPAIIVGGLNVLGFTASGVAGGSIAAGLQSSIYGGLTTGLFSTCQSIGATWVVGSGSIISGIGSLAAGATILGSPSRKTKTGNSNSESDASDAGGNSSRSASPHRTHERRDEF